MLTDASADKGMAYGILPMQYCKASWRCVPVIAGSRLGMQAFASAWLASVIP